MKRLKILICFLLVLAMAGTVVACGGDKTKDEKTVSTISVTDTAAEYFVGDAFSGGTLKVSYSDGTEENVTITSDMLSGFDTQTPGEKQVTVTYEGKSATFTITVKEVVKVPVEENFDVDASFTDSENWMGMTEQNPVMDTENGFLTFREKSNGSVAYAAKGMSTGTAELKLKLTVSSDTTATISFSNQSNNISDFCYHPGAKMYTVEFANDSKIYVKKWVDTQETQLQGEKSSASVPLTLATRFTDVKLEVAEENSAIAIKVYIGGQLLLDVVDEDDPILGGGAFGFSYMGTGGMVVGGKNSIAENYQEPEPLGMNIYESPNVPVAEGEVDFLADFASTWTGRERIFDTVVNSDQSVTFTSKDNPEEPQAGVTEYQGLYKEKIFGDVQFEYTFNVLSHGEWIMFWFRCVPEESTNVSIWGNKLTKENTNGYSMLIDPSGYVQIHKWSDGAQIWLNGSGTQLPGTVRSAMQDPNADITVKMSIESISAGGRQAVEFRVQVNDATTIIVQDTDTTVFTNAGYTGVQGYGINNGVSSIRLKSAVAKSTITL